MKSILSVLSLAVLIGVAACMSLQEYEDDDQVTNDLGWGIHVHIHFHNLLKKGTNVQMCHKNKCALCKKTDFNVSIATNGENANAAYDYTGCIIVAKRYCSYVVSFTLGGEKMYKNIYQELNPDTMMPCIHDKRFPKDADVCPYLYDVDLKKGKFCAKIVENFKITDTQIKHEVDLGCTDVTEEWLLK